MILFDTKLRAAERYTQRGIWLFLVGADGRTPIVSKGWFEHGVHDATDDTAEILKRLRAFPNANLSAALGAKSGAFVLDVDVKKGQGGRESLERLQRDFEPLPHTWRGLTPSGGGHIWFRQPAGKALRNRVHLTVGDGERRVRYSGIDVRTTGGSVCLPPSVRPDGAYSWAVAPRDAALADAPHWLVQIIDPPLPPKKAAPVRITSTEKVARYVEAAVNGECRDLASMGPNTGRNQKLFCAAANLGELIAAGVLHQDTAESALLAAASDCGLLREDGQHAVRQTIASGIRKGLSNGPREIAA